jgi:orotate phosphoribosyltransferase
MTTAEDRPILDLLRSSGAWLEGHFRLSSGLHSSAYLQCALVLQHPPYAAEIGTAIAQAMRTASPTAVLSPALGGIVIGHEVARALGVKAIFAEREGGRLTMRRGFTLSPADRVLVVEDVVTTGLSTRETIDVAHAAGATVAAAAAIVDRSDGRAQLDVPFIALVTLQVPAWEQAACPLCRQGLPLVKPGSRPTPSVG